MGYNHQRIVLNIIKAVCAGMLLFSFFSVNAQQTNTVQAKNPVSNQHLVCVSNNQLSCYRLSDGKKLWQNTSIKDSHDLILNENRLILTQDNNVKIFNARSGDLLHTFTQSSALFAPVISSGFLILSSHQGSISVLNAQTGELIWQRQLDSQWVYPPAISEGRLITGGQGAILWSLNLKNGHILWEKKLANELVYQPIISTTGVVISSFDGLVITIDIATGKTIWKTSLTTALTQLILNLSQQIIGSAYDGRLYSFDVVTGQLIWRTSVANSARFFYSSHAEHTASVNHKGQFHLINNDNGQISQELNIKGQHQVAPLITSNSIWFFPDKKPAFQLKLNFHNVKYTKNTLGGN